MQRGDGPHTTAPTHIRSPMQRAIAFHAAHRVPCLFAALLSLGAAPAVLVAQQPAAPPPAAAPVQRGIVVGQAIDKASGRPMPAVNIFIVGTALRTQTDLDGRYRLPVAPGVYSVRAQRLGNVAVQLDGIRVVAGTSVTANFALTNAVVQLQAVAVTAAPTKASSEDALLAMQKASSRVSDGISAEAIKRTPGSNAGDAIVRVTGVSIVDSKFAVVRGLAERYSNTLLNGVELPSPEPLKKIVPLDLFPSSLLESIVVSKTATPDKPGDFAGGSVEVTTKEFPNDRVAEVSLSTGYASQATLRRIPHLGQSGLDWLGFDQGRRRQMPSTVPGAGPATPLNEVFAEGLRNQWTPTPTPILPDLGAAVNVGDRFGGDNAPYGYVLSATYNRQTEATPNRLQQLVFDAVGGVPDQGYTSNEATTVVNVGAIANFAARLGATQKISWKTLYTRNAEERLSRTSGYETYSGVAERLIYQARYITRNLVQTQLTGDHLIAPLLNSRLEWRATVSASQRDEPENRSLVYFKTPTQTNFVLSPSNPSPLWFRFLEDRVRSAQVDWSVPITRVLRDGAQFKAGTLLRQRDRTFDAYFFRVYAEQRPDLAPILALPPEKVFAPEVLGGDAVNIRREGERSLPYESDDDVRSFYGMLDVPLLSRVRFIGGLRREEWSLNLFRGTRADTLGPTTRRRTQDNLLSGNMTVTLTDRQNLRLAAYQTVARPDPRELAPDYYVAITGDCANQGNPELQPSRILNGDVRWERYPRAGEIMAVSGFYKRFTQPIAEIVSFEGSSLCTTNYFNLESARLFGGELEVRRPLSFLPGALSRILAGANLTLIDSRSVSRIDSTLQRVFRLQGQSNVLANLNLVYTTESGRTDGSLLFNYFGDRIVRYGIASINAGQLFEVPNVMEQGRVSLDAKVRHRIGRSTFSLSARNLTDAEVIQYQESEAGRTRTGYFRPGIGINLGIGYALR